MTKERKIEILKDLLVQLSDSANILRTCEADERCEVVEECIKALEQQSSDCVSRAEVFEIIGNLMSIPYDFDRQITEKDVSESMDKIKALTPVTLTLPTSEDCVSRADARHLIAESFRKNLLGITFNKMFETLYKGVDELPPVTPTHGTCKECKYSSVHTISLDKIDKIRVCRIQFSKQIKDDYYCANYEKRGNETEIN